MLRYGAAEADCNQALSLDGSYTKAYLRRGAARFQLGRVQEAEADYRKVLKLEPSNRQAQEELKSITKVNFLGQNINSLKSPASLYVCHAILKSPGEQPGPGLRERQCRKDFAVLGQFCAKMIIALRLCS